LKGKEQADEPNIVKEGEEESREGKAPEDCDTDYKSDERS